MAFGLSLGTHSEGMKQPLREWGRGKDVAEVFFHQVFAPF